VEKTLGLSYERFEEELFVFLEKEWTRRCKI